MSHVLVTGGAGFIGSHTADALVKAGHSVRVLDNLDPQVHTTSRTFPQYMHPDVECVLGDVRNPQDVSSALKGIDAIFHFAASTGVGQSMYEIRSYVDVNCLGTATLIDAVMRNDIPLKRFVLASSRAVYGEGAQRCPDHGKVYPPMRDRQALDKGEFAIRCPLCSRFCESIATEEGQPLSPGSVYAMTKKTQEELCAYIEQTFAIPIIVLRYFNVYGSRQSLRNPYTGVLSVFYSRMRAEKPIFLYEHGRPVRDFVNVRDVVQANLRALTASTARSTYVNVGSGRKSTIKEIARLLADVAGIDVEFVDSSEFRVGDISSCYADLGRAQELLGYVPTVSTEEGIREFLEWAGGQEPRDLYAKTVDELDRHGLFGRVRDAK